MVTIIIWFFVVVNAFIWFGNWALTKSNDRSGSGMVLMMTVPMGIFISLVSLLAIALLT